MISWGTILYRATLSTIIAAAVFIFVKRERRPLTPALAATFLGPVAWNAILHRAGNPSDGFFVDIPFKPFPVSWQDTGSGVFTLAVASVVLSRAMPAKPARHVLGLAAIAATIAFVVDIYFY